MIAEQNLASTRALARRARAHAALADPHRLAIVDELTISDRSPTELGRTLEIGSNLLAHHLRILQKAGLIERQTSGGDRRRKYLRLVPEALDALAAPAATFAARQLLFVCTENSARSQLAEAIWNARHAVPASSAGTRPASRVHPSAVEAAAEEGLDLSSARPRSIDEVPTRLDVVVTVCDVAREEIPGILAHSTLLHWSIPDPTAIGRRSAFDDALRQVRDRVQSLAPHVRPAKGG